MSELRTPQAPRKCTVSVWSEAPHRDQRTTDNRQFTPPPHGRRDGAVKEEYEHRTSNAELRTLNFEQKRNTNIERRTSNVELRTEEEEYEHRTLNFELRTEEEYEH
jgi:hypothetical protein